MTMAIDHQQRQFGALNFDHIPYSNSPQFTNPWNPSSAPPPQNLYQPAQSMHQSMGVNTLPKQEPSSRISHHLPLSSYASVPNPATSTGSPSSGSIYAQQEMLTMPHDIMNHNRLQPLNSGYGSGVSYTSGGTSHPTYATSSPYDTMGYAAAPLRQTYATMQQPMHQDNSRRLSQPGMTAESTRDFGEAIDASRGMIAMSQNTTPRNIYGPNASRTGRGSGDSYGFPATHSTSSSISSTGAYPTYFGGSIDSSVSDYSNAGSDIESTSSRTLPRPSGFMTGGIPPAPASMMGQFSSKVSSSAQKKHKCKVCDKRFTRPSSLQTHMYSHTGEKPFSCEVEGCGRHFSVVSNLRRHRKVHKGENQSEAGSDDHHSDN